MLKKCFGCGSTMQAVDKEKEGYVRPDNYETSKLCERCFRIQNYGDYKVVAKSNEEFIQVLNRINDSKDLVVLVVDIFNLSKDIELFSRYLSNDIILVMTKRDLLPKSIRDEKLLSYMNHFDIKTKGSLMISSFKNYHMDELMNLIRKYQKSKNVYIVGLTNSGKSTMVNKILYNYSDNEEMITTSMLPSTTLREIEIKLDETLTLIDTPGLLDDGNMTEHVDIKTLKKITPKHEIRPITYQVKVDQTILFENLMRLDIKCKNSVTIYVANTVRIERLYKETEKLKDLEHISISVDADTDVVIAGLGFVHFKEPCEIEIYVVKGTLIYTRRPLI